MIQAVDIAKYYGAHAALEHLNLTVDTGEVVGLLGLNGAGKTTTLRILSGLLVPSRGDVIVGGVAMSEDGEAARRRIGFLPETPPLYQDMRVRAYLEFAGRIRGVGKEALAPQVDAALAATDLLGVQHARIATLSHGYHRRIGIAQTLVHSPAVILLDEPTSGLDPVQVVHMRKLIDNLRGRATILISSHVLTEIHALCDRIVVLDEGRVIAQGTEAELATGGQGSMHVVLEVQGDAEALQRLLISLPYVRAAGTPEPLAAHLRLDVELSHDARDQLCAALVQANVGVLTLARQPVALEQTFLRLMGQRASGDPEERPS
jgi:ABC-2 type transport system ATP-binding protein